MRAYSASPCPSSERRIFPLNAEMLSFFTEFTAGYGSCSKMLPWGDVHEGEISIRSASSIKSNQAERSQVTECPNWRAIVDGTKVG